MANLLDGLAALFRLPPERASAFLKAKGLTLTGPYWELDGPAHSRNFTVANLAKLDVLADIQAAVQGAMDHGQTERWFKQQLVDTLKAKGWWGPTVSVDPVTGEARLMQQGSLRRLQTIYRTNLQSAYMAGRHAQALEQSDRAPFAQYLAVRDSRSRPAHAALHDKVFRLDSPEWSIISPPNGYNCFPADTPVRADATLGLKTWYAGPMVELQTRHGHRLTVTANHPVLTSRGWIAAASVQEGTQMLCAAGVVDARLVGIVDHEQPPARAEDLFESLALQGLRVAPLAPHDFHGDARFREGEIHIAGADGPLVDEREPQAHEFVGEGDFRRRNARLGMDADTAGRPASRDIRLHDPRLAQDSFDVGWLGPCLPGNRPRGGGPGPIQGQGAALQVHVGSITGSPSRGELSLDGGGVCLDALPLLGLSSGAVAQGDAAGAELSVEHFAGATNPFGELLEANPSRIISDQAVNVRHFDFRGHVYDFQTRTGLILAGGVVVHNCRCRARYLSQRELDKRGLKVEGDTRILERTPQKVPSDPLTGESPDRILERGVSVPSRTRPGERDVLWADRGWDHLPGSDGAERALVDRVLEKAATFGSSVSTRMIDAAPPAVAGAMIRRLAAADDLARWLAAPEGNQPLAVLPLLDRQAIGAKTGVAVLSPETAAKQVARHPELTPAEYARAQDVIDRHTARVQDSDNSLIYALEEENVGEGGGYVLVVKATRTGDGLFVTSYRRLSRADAARDAEVARLLRKRKK